MPLPLVLASVRSSLADALGLLFPVWCAGCDQAGRDLCEGCVALLTAAAPSDRDVDGLAVRSALRFDGVAASVVRGLKEDGRTGLARPLGALLARASSDAAWDDCLLVPVPTSRASLRRRGYAVVELLAERTERPWAPLLRIARTAADQRRLGRDDRARNVAGTLRATDAAAATSVVILDDVVTTGATLREARRALERAGANVRGALTLADTPRRFPPVIPP